MKRTIHYDVPKESAKMLVKDILHRHFGLSVRQVSRLKFRPDGILVNGERVTVRHVLRPGDRLCLCLETEEQGSDHLDPVPGPLDFCYEDDDMLVLHKPAGIVVHPSHGHYNDTLANRLVCHYLTQGQRLVVRPVGRLDKDTSGLLIFAKHAAAAACFDRQRREGILSRTYLALAEGCPTPLRGRIEAPIGRADGSLILRQVRADGEMACTDYEVLLPGSEYSLLKLTLHTGRTHQIRVHMAHLGHPLLGDPFYGVEGSFGMGRTALHSARIGCCQPFSKEPLVFRCPLPADMRALAGRLGNTADFEL